MTPDPEQFERHVVYLAREAEEGYRHDALIRSTEGHLRSYIRDRALYRLHRLEGDWSKAEDKLYALLRWGLIEAVLGRFEQSVSLLERLAIQSQDYPA